MMYWEALTKDFANTSKLVAICDSNKGRLELAFKKAGQFIPDLKAFIAGDFDKMLHETQADTVIVCTRDCSHDEYIVRALEHGCDVITEKPMTTDAKKCQRIIDATQKTGKNVRVTFNYRYSPVRSQIKELLMKGVIGKVLSVSFQWNLDTSHGADYYRRWHRNKENSGGLLVHKATHHFDLVNWWLGDIPVAVGAQGKRAFYNSQQANLYGLKNHAERCLDCKLKSQCNFYMDIEKSQQIKELYYNNEREDGYIRDKCVFSDSIDIEDTMSVQVQYKCGAVLTYALNSFAPYEGYKIEFNGTKGRLEHICQETSYINGDGTVQGVLKPEGTSIKVFPHFQTPYSIEPYTGTGGHGGGDSVMLNDIFGTPAADSLKRAANYVQGAYSILVGIAANESIAMGKYVNVERLVTGLPEHGYPKNAGQDEQIAFVSETKKVHCSN